MKLAAVLGWPIGHSKSPILHGTWLKQYNIDGAYIPLPVEAVNFEHVLKTLPKMGFEGCNVTVPHKEQAYKLADSVTPMAKRLKAANTIKFGQDGSIHADNTDGYGFIANLEHSAKSWSPGKGPAFVLGAGGASRAIIAALLDAGTPEVILANRTKSRAEKVAADLGGAIKVIDLSESEKYLGKISLLVNTTSMGMANGPKLDFSMDNLSKQVLVTDIVYNPLETPFLQQAKKTGCKTVDGLGMLLHQAVPGFESWFGIRPQVTEELRSNVLGLV